LQSQKKGSLKGEKVKSREAGNEGPGGWKEQERFLNYKIKKLALREAKHIESEPRW
jgi:hypothetical protein